MSQCVGFGEGEDEKIGNLFKESECCEVGIVRVRGESASWRSSYKVCLQEQQLTTTRYREITRHGGENEAEILSISSSDCETKSNHCWTAA